MKKAVFTALILIGCIALNLVCVLPVKAQYEGYIAINASGSIYPSTAPIQQAGNVYTLTDDIKGRIVVNKNNTVLDGDGHTLTYEYGVGAIAALSVYTANNTVKNLIC